MRRSRAEIRNLCVYQASSKDSDSGGPHIKNYCSFKGCQAVSRIWLSNGTSEWEWLGIGDNANR